MLTLCFLLVGTPPAMAQDTLPPLQLVTAGQGFEVRRGDSPLTTAQLAAIIGDQQMLDRLADEREQADQARWGTWTAGSLLLLSAAAPLTLRWPEWPTAQDYVVSRQGYDDAALLARDQQIAERRYEGAERDYQAAVRARLFSAGVLAGTGVLVLSTSGAWKRSVLQRQRQAHLYYTPDTFTLGLNPNGLVVEGSF